MRSLRPLLLSLATRLIGTSLGLALAWQVAVGAAAVQASAPPPERATLAFAVPGPAANLVLVIQP